MKGPPDRPFPFLDLNDRPDKPRDVGVTEIRGPYYDPVGPRRLSDIFETVGWAVDSVKFSGGSFALMPEPAVREILDLCHDHDALVSTGGFAEWVLTQGDDAFDRYVDGCKDLGFDIVEISAGFLSLTQDDHVRMVQRVQEAGLKAKPELGIQFGAGGTSSVEALEEDGTQDVDQLIHLGERMLDEDVHQIMIESEGITEQVEAWRTDVVSRIVDDLGTDNVMFEAADAPVFQWYVKNYGPEVNLFVDHSQILHLECLRSGIWTTKDLWGRVHTYKG